MLSDTLFEALCEIEMYEKDLPQCYADSAEEIRTVKLEMRILQLRFDMVPETLDKCTDADFDWLKAEALKRGAERPPYEFCAVFNECMGDFWKKKAGV